MDQEKYNEAIAMNKAGVSIPAISHELGVSAQTIRNWFIAQGNSKPSAPTPDKDVKVVEAYEAGMVTAEILSTYNIARGRLYYLLSKYSVPTRQQAMENSRSRALDEACAMYEQGYVIRQITADTGVHQPTLHAELARREIPLRRPRARS